MRELEHKREIERLWQEKLVIYKAQREAEAQEQEFKRQEEARQRDIIAEEKARLLREEEDMSMYDDITKAPLHMPPRPDKPSKTQANKITHAEVPVELIDDLTEYLEDMSGLTMKGSGFIKSRARDLLLRMERELGAL